MIRNIQTVWAASRRICAEDSFKNARTYFLKSLVRPALAARWVAFSDQLFAQAGDRRAPSFFLRKHVRSYAVNRWTPMRRVQAAMDHYDMLAETHPASPLRALPLIEEIEIAQVAGRKATYRYVARCSPEMFREGEISLSMYAPDHASPLATITFLFCRDDEGRRCAVIGGLQGPRGEASKRAVISATRDLFGMRPKQAVFEIVLQLASLSGCVDVYGVSNDTHVSIARDQRLGRGRIRASYDDFWRERGGVDDAAFGFRFSPSGGASRPTVSAPSDKRAKLRASFAHVAALCLAIVAGPISDFPPPRPTAIQMVEDEDESGHKGETALARHDARGEGPA